MAPSPTPQISTPTPFSAAPSVDTASFASIFATMSDNFDGTTALPPSALSSALSSLLSASSASAASIASSRQSVISSQRASQTAGPGNSLTTSTASTPTSNRISGTATASSSTSNSSSSSSTAANSAGLQKDANSGLSSGTQAAIAVPIVVGVLAIAAFIFLCMRRRKRRQPKAPLEKTLAAKGSKKWSRHLRIFSFDTELLMGGRFSSTNSIRSQQAGSLRSAGSRQGHSHTPSLHSVDEVAPPYRDAITAARPPSSVARAMTGSGVAPVSGVDRNASVSTGPPPYGPGQTRDLVSPTTPTSIPHRNPFGDNHPINPLEASPFNDPPGTSPAMSRNSSFYHGRDDASSMAGGSDAGSIRQATLVRNASVMSGGRVINDVSRP